LLRKEARIILWTGGHSVLSVYAGYISVIDEDNVTASLRGKCIGKMYNIRESRGKTSL